MKRLLLIFVVVLLCLQGWEFLLPRSGARWAEREEELEQSLKIQAVEERFNVHQDNEVWQKEMNELSEKTERFGKAKVDIWKKLMIGAAILISAWWWKSGGLHKIAPPKHHG